MAYGTWFLAALLATPPALADEAAFQGHEIEADGPAGARRVLRTLGTRYAIPGAQEQLVGKAQLCLIRRDSGAGIVSVDPAGGRLVAIARVEYAQGPVVGIAKARLAVQAAGGSFSVVLGDPAITQGRVGAATEEVFSPVLMRGDAAWEPPLAALIRVEQALVDCMFR